MTAVEKVENPFSALENPVTQSVCAFLEKNLLSPFAPPFRDQRVALQQHHVSFGRRDTNRAVP